MNILKSIALLVTIMLSNQLSAHTKLADSVPKDGSVMSSSPKELKLIFSGNVKLMKVDLKTKDGDKVKLAFMLSSLSSETFSIPLTNLDNGHYVVHWIAMGKDSHKMTGSFSFKIQSEKHKENKTQHESHNH